MEIDAPVVIGFFAPRLLLPAALAGSIETCDLEQIALHEMEHLRRRDDWVNLGQKLALVLFPLHPALLWIDRRLSEERELACDAGVVARTAAPVRYAACLARLAEHRLRGRVAALSLAAWGRRPELVRRVETLLRPEPGLSRMQTLWATGLVIVVMAAGAVEMARAPRLVSLAEPVSERASAADVVGTADAGLVTNGPRAVPVVYREAAGWGGVVVRESAYVGRPLRVSAGRGRTGGSQRKIQSSSGGTPSVPQRLKPHILLSHHGTAEAVPFGRGGGFSTAGAVFSRTSDDAFRTAEAVSFHKGSAIKTAGVVADHGDAVKHRGLDATPSSGHTERPQTIPAVPVYTLTIQHTPSYAAVPFGDGWILVQL